MKTLQFSLFTLVLCLFTTVAHAALKPIQDTTLTTSDRLCSVHYLTHANTTGWYIAETTDLSCASGAVNGNGTVVIHNAFGTESDRLTGYFNQGFWVGSNPFLLPLKALYLTDGDTHTLTADFGGEERLNIHYIARLNATRRSDNTYGPFLGCDPVQVIAITPDPSLFEDESIQQNLITSVIQKSESVCPTVSQIYFYASDLENPDNKDIFFFADINLEKGDIKIRRLPNSPKNQDILQNPSDRAPVIPMPREVRREKAIPIMAVKPLIPEAKHHDRAQSLIAQPTPPTLPPPTLQPVQSGSLPTPAVITADPTPTPPAPDTTLDLIPNLLTASRLLKQPVSGTALIHIARFDSKGTVLTDSPVSLRVKGAGLSLGWGIATGDFSYQPSDGTLPDIHGFIQIKSFTPTNLETP